MALLARTRDARLRQDSALAHYSADVVQRLTLRIAIGRNGRDRLAYRHENAARIDWWRGQSVQVALKGSRTFVGAWAGNFGGATDRDLANAVPIPYFPGREQLWSGEGMVTDFVGQARATQDSINTRELVNPLAAGAERFYRYALGDSLILTLPGERRIVLRELRVTALAPRWNLVVGSFWLDDASASLVRASYRLAAATDLLEMSRESSTRRATPKWLGALLSPLQYEIDAVVVEFGLVGESFWLPRLQYLEGRAQAGGVRAPMRIEQRFTYLRAEARGRVAGPAVAGTRAPESPADPLVRSVSSRRYGGAVLVHTTVPRDRAALQRALELPPSIFDDGEETFAARDRVALLRALGMDLQAEWAPQPLQWRYGLSQTRFNRVEGLSTAVGVSWMLGHGLHLESTLRGSVADRQLNGELAAERGNGRRRDRVALYRRLAESNDWGSPLSPAASLGAFLFGRDDGAYYRSSGLELRGERTGADAGTRALTWRLFAERQRAARVETGWNLLGPRDRGLSNPVADAATQVGAAVRVRAAREGDARGFLAHADLRLEAAGGDFAYGRGLLDLSASRGIAGPLLASVSTALGATTGRVPVQRQFALGGPQSLRGHRALTATGDAVWLARSELALDSRTLRPSVFADLGWVGERREWHRPGRPLTGAGVGLSVFDGLARVDLARALRPSGALRLTLALDARF